jgi:hypothetical protein
MTTHWNAPGVAPSVPDAPGSRACDH